MTRPRMAEWNDGTAERLLAELALLPPDDRRRDRLRRELVELHSGFVRSVARRYASRGEPLEDVEQAGLLGLVKAINRFDPELGTRFLAYAAPMVIGEIKRHFRDSTWVVQVPRRLQELRISMRQAIEDFTTAHGRSPTVQELAQLLDTSEEEIVDCLGTGDAYRPSSLDVPLTDDTAATAGEMVGDLDPALGGIVDATALRPLLNSLPERDRTIVLLRFWGNRTQTEIAEEVGLSQMHISRILSRSLAYLRTGLTTED